MKNDREWIVPLRPVPDADRVVRAVGLALPAPQRAARVTELRRQVRDGYFATDMNRGFLASEPGQALIGRIPIGRSGQPEDLDGALLLLASEAGSYIAGATIVCDGGQMVALRG